VDPETGRIIDQRHPQVGEHVGARVLVMASGRGSSSSSTVLAETLRAGCGPAAILLAEKDEILVLGALVVALLDSQAMPIVQLRPEDYARLHSGDLVHVHESGRVEVSSGQIAG
jgi:predicted aconitase with swiveling domain